MRCFMFPFSCSSGSDYFLVLLLSKILEKSKKKKKRDSYKIGM